MYEILNVHVDDFGTFKRTRIWIRGWQKDLKHLFQQTQVRYITGATGPETELTFEAIYSCGTPKPTGPSTQMELFA